MKNLRALKSRRQVTSSPGFALVVTLTLMVLLSILAIGMLSLSTVSLRSMSADSADQIARANARLGLITAMGELQRLLGPDQRISARATSFAADSTLGVTVQEKTPGAWWVGVAHGKPGELLPEGKNFEWLVSGVNSAGAPGNASLSEPIPMYSENSLDLSRYTGGEEISAGRVAILDSSSKKTGNYAYFIDDEGMKAQLAPSNPKARNSLNAGRGMLGSGAELGKLNEMVSLGGADPSLLSKLTSLEEIPFVGGAETVSSQKFFDFTTRSFGVLSDTRRGGLRKDLTIAFENDAVFDKVFPKSDKSKYLLIDPDRLAQASDLQSAGYIQWDIFKDYYNMKKYIQSSGGTEFLDHTSFEKRGFFDEKPSGDFYNGKQGPHQMKPGGNHAGHPYGNYAVMLEENGKTGEYRHSPVSPVLSFLQMNAWLEPKTSYGALPPSTTPTNNYYLEMRTQLWTGHYNPYNIGLRVKATNNSGPRIMNFPQAVYRIPQYSDGDKLYVGFNQKRQTSQQGGVILNPGRSHVMGLSYSATAGAENDSGPYSEQVQNITNESVYYSTDKKTPKPTGNIDVRIDFVMNRPSLLHGCNEDPENREASQILFTPFAWEETEWSDRKKYPGKRFEYSVPESELGFNKTKSILFALRTTKEGGNAIRPLVDSNIRAPWVSPKWDFGMGLASPAAYNTTNGGEPFSKNIEMNHSDAPKGYSYLGSSTAASNGFDRVILYDVPREDLVSLGQLQHANAGRFSYEPSYIVGNSYANVRIPQGSWKTTASDQFSNATNQTSQWAIPGNFNLYDASYLVNEVMWDSYIFTTLPQMADNHAGNNATDDYDRLLRGDALLPNPRFIPYKPEGSSFDEVTLKQEGTATQGSFFHNAGHLLVDGAFNIHSTSVDAWEAFLSSTRALPVEKVSGTGKITGYDSGVEKIRFPRVKATFGGAAGSGNSGPDFWTGFRELEQDEVRDLAEAIVEEIKSRGPFHGLSEFVNRKLDTGEAGASGTLQTALDKTVNKNISSTVSSTAGNGAVPANQPQAAGFPGHLIQGDILQALSPYMTARSDTFTIRSYGEAVNKDGEVTARAWCEATVQRLPDAMPSTLAGGTILSELASPSSPFGRRFTIRSFRWLNPEEV